MAKKTVNMGGRQVEGESIQFKTIEEPWCAYECADGTKIRIKVVVSEIVRLDGAFSLEVVATEVPDELRMKPAGPGRPGNYV